MAYNNFKLLYRPLNIIAQHLTSYQFGLDLRVVTPEYQSQLTTGYSSHAIQFLITIIDSVALCLVLSYESVSDRWFTECLYHRFATDDMAKGKNDPRIPCQMLHLLSLLSFFIQEVLLP
jgi:hypothetical protein